MKKEKLTIAKNIFNESNPVKEWKFEDVQYEVEKAIDDFPYTDIEDDDVKEIVEDSIKKKLYDVFYAAIVAASTEEEKEDERGIDHVAGEWSFLAFERGEKFPTEQEIYDSVKDDVEYAREELADND